MLCSKNNIIERKREMYMHINKFVANDFLFEDERPKQIQSQLVKLLGKFKF